MRYEEYEKKILKIAKIKKTIFRFRFPIIASVSATVFASGALVGTKGIVVDNVKLESKYTYGETISYSSSSFMSDVSYEFSPFDNEDWTNETPVRIGKYKMRSKGKNSFNSYYYGDEQVFEITPKVIDVEANEDELPYGELPSIDLSNQLVFGDTLKNDYTFSIKDKEKEYWSITPELESLHIYSNTGEDVSECYSFNILNKSIKILKKALTIQTSSAKKVFDDIPLEEKEFEIISGELIDGDEISLVSNTSLNKIGSVDNEHDYKITNKLGEDMTLHYDISLNKGTLEVEKIPLSLSTQNYEYIYDGEDKKFSLDDVSITGNVLDGHKLVLDYSEFSCFRNAGEYTNSFKAYVFKGSTDVSDYYDISTSFGTTSIAKQPLEIQSGSTTKVYDKDPLSDTSYIITKGTLVNGHKISVSSSSSITDVGSVSNTQSFKILDSNSNNVTSNYDISLSKGTLKVDPIDLEVSIVPLATVYDGKPHNVGYSFDETLLVKDDHLEVTYNEEKTDCGTYDADTFAVDILTSENVDNSSNYRITYSNIENALTINKRDISLKINGYEMTYDSTKITSKSFDPYTISEGALADDEYIYFKYNEEPYLASAEPYEIKCDIEIYHKLGDTPDIENDKLVTSNYNIDTDFEEFIINKRVIKIQSMDIVHEYDRCTSFLLENPPISISYDGDGLVSGHHLEGVNISTTGVNVGTYSYDIDMSDVKVLDANDNDVTDNYAIISINTGVLTITQRDVMIYMEADSQVYDGTFFSSSKYSADRLLENDYVTFDGLPQIKYVEDGYVTNTPTSWKVFTEGGVDVSSNYHCTIDTLTKDGRIHIEPRPITIRTPSFTKIFDNEVVSELPSVEITEGSLVTGDTLVINRLTSYDGGCLHVGSYVNEAQITFYNSEHVNISKSYKVTFDCGYITINPRPVKLDIREENIVYDGYSHNKTYWQGNVTPSSSDVYIVEGSLPANFTLSAQVSINNMINAGTYNKYSTNLYIYYMGDTYSYPDDFAFTFVQGSQKITKRDITLTALGGSKIYNDKPFDYGVDKSLLYSITFGSLADYHEIIGIEFTSVKDPGVHAFNILSFHIIDSRNNEDVSSNYNVTLVGGEVKIYEL